MKKLLSLLFFSLSLSRLTNRPSTYECDAGNSLCVDEKVHQSDTREIISFLRAFFFSACKGTCKKKGKARQRDNAKERKREEDEEGEDEEEEEPEQP
jgi:hypothetical protein